MKSAGGVWEDAVQYHDVIVFRSVSNDDDREEVCSPFFFDGFFLESGLGEGRKRDEPRKKYWKQNDMSSLKQEVKKAIGPKPASKELKKALEFENDFFELLPFSKGMWFFIDSLPLPLSHRSNMSVPSVILVSFGILTLL